MPNSYMAKVCEPSLFYTSLRTVLVLQEISENQKIATNDLKVQWQIFNFEYICILEKYEVKSMTSVQNHFYVTYPKINRA